jgi:3-methyl-2-oxobutanoate hydroxymethyltransferase
MPAVTLKTLRARVAKGEPPFACLTCYDATSARWLARAGVHVLLVGDTAAEVVLGFSRTIDMPLEIAIALTAGVKRGAPYCVVMADMPFMSYHADDASAIRNAGRFLVEGMADIVKMEVDASFEEVVAKIVRAGVPICGHIGSRPQRAALTSGYTGAGKTDADAQQIVRDALAMERAGCSMLLLEAVPENVTAAVLSQTRIPLIGIGAGPACHGQVLVLHDLLGMSDKPPVFAKPMGSVGIAIEQAAREWVAAVAAREVKRQAH